MRGAVFHDLLSSCLTRESISHVALEVKSTYLASRRTGHAETVSLCAE